MDALAPQLSYISIVLLVIATVDVVIGLLFPVSKTALKWICAIGLSTAGMMSVLCGIIYVWHHYYRLS
ncbi:MAG: hypothetical protein J0L93_10015 [Deltaproteobacteria bacterium]|nr:hypothetical protein [Deltaproteobacteria bacterium]